MKNLILGTLSIIIGVFAFIYPLSSVETASKIAGVSTLLLSIYLIASSKKRINSSKIMGIITILFSILLIYSAFNRFTSIYYYAHVVSIIYYLTAILAIIVGIYIIIHVNNNKSRIIGIIGVALGVLYILIGYLTQNPVYLGIVVSLYLIIFGLSKIFGFNFYRIGTVMNKLIKIIYRNLK